MSRLFVPFECADCQGRFYPALGGYFCHGCGNILLHGDVVLEPGEIVQIVADLVGYTHPDDCADCNAGVTGWHGYISEGDL